MLPYDVIEPTTPSVPIVVSVPHCGELFPQDIAADYMPQVLQNPDDTDWFVDRLYDFVGDLGITMIRAKYSRYVIDLNRSLHDQPLYNDGRVTTSLVPHCDFLGHQIYRQPSNIPTQKEIQRRLDAYYMPYHNKVKELLEQHQRTFGHVLLFDAHSIKKSVPTIQNTPFPDLILGDNDLQSASQELIETALQSLNDSQYEFSHNHPFKGGYITRNFGNPKQKIHALQLEMAKTNYMDETERHYNESKAQHIRGILKDMFVNLIQTLEKI